MIISGSRSFNKSVRNFALPAEVVFPTDEFIQYLRLRNDCRVYELSEQYAPSCYSLHLPGQRYALTQVRSRVSQYLVKAKPSLGIVSNAGLLHLGGKSIIYELNYSNFAYLEKKTKNSISTGRYLLEKIKQNTVCNHLFPPGWHVSSKKTQVYPGWITYFSSHNNPNYFHSLTIPGQCPIFLEEQFLEEEEQLNPFIITAPEIHRIPKWTASICSLLVGGRREIKIESAAMSILGSHFSLQQIATPIGVSPKLTKWIHNKVYKSLGRSDGPRQMLFVSRGDTRKRKCINETQLYSRLSPLGFRWCQMDKLTVLEQLNLFRTARCIVSPHGAALSNLVACDEQATVIELLPPDGDYGHYFMISDVLRLRHAHIVGKCTDMKTDCFYVDPCDVISMLRHLGIIE